MEKHVYQVNANKKKTHVVILISFIEINSITRNNESDFTII